MRHVALLLLSTSMLLMAAEQPTDAEMLAMAKRRLSVNDIGITFEQMAAQRGRNDQIVPAGDPTIVMRGKAAADMRLPVRFQVPVMNGRFAGGDEPKAVAIIDAWFWRDTFGTWSMEWRYNVDQSLVAMEARQAAIMAAEQKDPDLLWRRKLPTMLKSVYFPAQVQFQGGNYEDDDGNGIGDFAKDLEVMDGTRKPKGAPDITLSLLPKTFIPDLAKAGITYSNINDAERGCWMFAVLPSGELTYLIGMDGMVRELPGRVLPKTVAEAKEAAAKGVVYKFPR